MPRSTRRAWRAGGLILPLAVSLAGFASPALAAPHSMPVPAASAPDPDWDGKTWSSGFTGSHEKAATSPHRAHKAGASHHRANPGGGGDPRPHHNDHEKKEQGRPPEPSEQPTCVAVDAYAPSGSEEFIAALLPNGDTYAGRRDISGGDPNETDVDWQNLSEIDNYPDNVCDATISAQGPSAWVKVITTEGEIWQLHCEATGQELNCPDPNDPDDEQVWLQLESPTDTLASARRGSASPRTHARKPVKPNKASFKRMQNKTVLRKLHSMGL